MTGIPGARPPRRKELTRAQDRFAFVFLEHCVISREDSAVTATDDKGTIHIPAATIGALLLGPGTRVTHQAMVLLSECGASVVWVGENGVRYYAHGRSLSASTRLLETQARLVSNRDTRLSVARAMYGIRFPGEDVSRQTMQQLRGREGARVRRTYRDCAAETGIIWSKRDFNPDDFSASDPINQALSAATVCLYGAVQAVVVAIGCSPGLGFVHTGHERAFVFDIADLYKAETAIPVAFSAAAENLSDLSGHVRRAMRDCMFTNGLMERCVRDIKWLLTGDFDNDSDNPSSDSVSLWDGRGGVVPAGKS